MRVSENMKTLGVFADLNRTMERMLKVQDQLTTSKRINRPSDDPGGTARVLNLKGYLNRCERYQKNVDDGSQWIIATESVLNQVVDDITEMDSIMMQANNDTLGSVEREILASQMQEMLSQIVGLANQKLGDRYLFGGTHYVTAPLTLSDIIEDESFTADVDTAVALEYVGIDSGSVSVTTLDGLTEFTEGIDYTVDYEDGMITVLGSGSMADGSDYLISYETEKVSVVTVNPDGVDGVLLRKIDESVPLQINVNASSVFSGSGGLIDVIQQAVVALERNDKSAFNSIRGQLEACLDETTRIQGDMGSKIKRLEMQSEKLDMDEVNLRKLISTILDTDVASAILHYQKDQYIYQAALQTGSNLIQVSLLDFLK